MSEDKKGWDFADGFECLTYHDKNTSFPGNENITFAERCQLMT